MNDIPNPEILIVNNEILTSLTWPYRLYGQDFNYMKLYVGLGIWDTSSTFRGKNGAINRIRVVGPQLKYKFGVELGLE